jgi:hypothetical protein
VMAAIDAVDDPNGASSKPELRLEIRSVGEIIQFLGDLLEYQDELGRFLRDNPATKMRLNNPLTFGYCPDEKGTASRGCADIFFNLMHSSCNARFSVNYRGRKYSIPNYNPPDSSVWDKTCTDEESAAASSNSARDHSLEVLAVVHQLVDLQKSAQDIKETPYVQLLP